MKISKTVLQSYFDKPFGMIVTDARVAISNPPQICVEKSTIDIIIQHNHIKNNQTNVSTELEKQILENYQSIKMPYDYTNEKELQCLVDIFNYDYETNIDSETYLNTMLKFNIPPKKQ